MWPNLMAVSFGFGSLLASHREKAPLLVGLNGAQGSGKSTTALLLAETLTYGHGLNVLQCSIDDFYLERSSRQSLASKHHPLFITRGVPGTHDMQLLNKTLDDLLNAKAHQKTLIPRFSKALDDRLPQSEWQQFEGCPDLIILEGWCVGSTPEPDAELTTPINTLEAMEDPDGIWRKFVNEALKNDYQDTFDRLNFLALLKIPNFSKVFEWRLLQEQKLLEENRSLNTNRILDPLALKRFIMHFERITRWNQKILPQKADLTLEIDESHRFERARFKFDG